MLHPLANLALRHLARQPVRAQQEPIARVHAILQSRRDRASASPPTARVMPSNRARALASFGRRCGRASAASAGPSRQPVHAAVARPQHGAIRLPRARSTTTVLPLRSALGSCRLPNEIALTPSSPCRTASITCANPAVGITSADRVAHHPARDFAVAVSADAVGHRPDADVRPLDERVLIDLAHVADVAPAARTGTAAASPRRSAPRRFGRDVELPSGIAPQPRSVHPPSSSAANVSGCGQAAIDQAARLDDRRPFRPPDDERAGRASTGAARAVAEA